MGATRIPIDNVPVLAQGALPAFRNLVMPRQALRLQRKNRKSKIRLPGHLSRTCKGMGPTSIGNLRTQHFAEANPANRRRYSCARARQTRGGAIGLCGPRHRKRWRPFEGPKERSSAGAVRRKKLGPSFHGPEWGHFAVYTYPGDGRNATPLYSSPFS